MSSHSPSAQERFDRHLRLASALTGEASPVILNKFLSEIVLLTGEPQKLATKRGRIMFLTSANLIARFCPRIHLEIPRGLPLAADTLQLLNEIDKSVYTEFKIVEEADYETYCVVLSVGVPRTRCAKLIVVDSAGWLASLSRANPLEGIDDSDDGNPFGALMAAVLGSAEVFKYVLRPREGKAFHFGEVRFSTYDYSINGLDPGPKLPKDIQLPSTLLAGVGAVGNAVLFSLSHVEGLRGPLTVVDRESVDDPSNLTRYTLAVENDATPQNPLLKTELAVRLFKGTRVNVRPLQEKLEQSLNRIYNGEIERPEIVVSAVDNNEARELVQKLWPSLLIEGATGDTVSQVSRHEYDKGRACLMCIHSVGQPQGEGFSYAKKAAELSGLATERVALSLRDDAVVVTEDDVRNAPEEKRDFLAAQVGKPVCSVLSEVEKMSTKPAHELPREPTVSFVSMASGLLAAAELVKYAGDMGSSLETFFQMDSMFPLSNALVQAVEKTRTCYCSLRREEIGLYREMAGRELRPKEVA